LTWRPRSEAKVTYHASPAVSLAPSAASAMDPLVAPAAVLASPPPVALRLWRPQL
jgi:hypothetical protein